MIKNIIIVCLIVILIILYIVYRKSKKCPLVKKCEFQNLYVKGGKWIVYDKNDSKIGSVKLGEWDYIYNRTSFNRLESGDSSKSVWIYFNKGIVKSNSIDNSPMISLSNCKNYETIVWLTPDRKSTLEVWKKP
jgi:hypothetical protein